MSTYSPSLRIQLINTGDQAGTWGNTTNINLGTLLESAIAGYTTVSITSANQALTALNGADDQSRNLMLALTTTTGAAFNVYAPPAEKSYVIHNASSQLATIYNSTVIGNTTAAGLGVQIPAGRTVTVWSDGTNFAAQNTHSPSLTLGAPLAVDSGGTGAATATDARTNLNVPTRTGTDASGTWGISITGNAATATNATNATTQSPGTNNTTIANTAFVQTAVQAALQIIYPVGSIYTNASVSTNPATLFGFGTWVLIQSRFLVGYGAGDPIFASPGATGGSRDATLVSHSHSATSTVNDPGHTHTVDVRGGFESGSFQYPVHSRYIVEANIQTRTSTTGISVSTSVNSAGSSATNANLPPYLVVYMWQRTA